MVGSIPHSMAGTKLPLYPPPPKPWPLFGLGSPPTSQTSPAPSSDSTLSGSDAQNANPSASHMAWLKKPSLDTSTSRASSNVEPSGYLAPAKRHLSHAIGSVPWSEFGSLGLNPVHAP